MKRKESKFKRNTKGTDKCKIQKICGKEKN